MAKRQPVAPKETVNPITDTPLDNRIILLEDTAPAIRDSGIMLAGSVGGITLAGGIKPYIGTILAVGPEVKSLKVMDRVRYYPNAGMKVTIDLEEYLVVRESDILTKLK